MLACICKVHPSATLLSDASGTWSCGALCDEQWFQIRWPESWASVHITVKELLPTIVACCVWGRQWQGKTVRVRCDNAAVVAILRSGWSKNWRVSTAHTFARSTTFLERRIVVTDTAAVIIMLAPVTEGNCLMSVLLSSSSVLVYNKPAQIAEVPRMNTWIIAVNINSENRCQLVFVVATQMLHFD